jgi:hypothetical protein
MGLRTRTPSMLSRQASTLLAIVTLLGVWLVLVAHV